MYTVSLPDFHGPLDLLLHLVRKHEVDVLDVPVGAIADGFLDHLRAMQTLDVELAGDFLVMAATLLEIKSRALLPADTPAAAAVADEAPDPRRELVRQLLEYRKVKDAAAALEERADRAAARSARVEPPEPAAKNEPVVRPVELWDLVGAFARLMRETRALETTTLSVDDTPQHVYEAHVRRRVEAAGRVALRDLFEPPYHRARLIGLFLAVLELMKAHAVALEQPDPFGDIWLTAGDANRDGNAPTPATPPDSSPVPSPLEGEG